MRGWWHANGATGQLNPRPCVFDSQVVSTGDSLIHNQSATTSRIYNGKTTVLPASTLPVKRRTWISSKKQSHTWQFPDKCLV